MIKRPGHYISTVIFILLTSLISTFAQSSPPKSKGVISGFVIETRHQKPVEYANVVLYNQKNKEQITGTITDENGYFQLSGLRFGMYLLEIKFIGFDAFSLDSIFIRPSKSEINLGRIEITPDVLALGSVEVLGEKPIIEFQIDKKVINVSKQFTTLSGNAIDVLENVPSVSVDIEGNVSLRGSGSFNLLIDGRPTILDANDALKTIPASTIGTIEIVTNPSAKYDPDGVAGIINIITKKSESQGTTGITNLNAGSFGNYGGDFLLSYHRDKVNYYIGADYNNRNMPGNMVSNSRTTQSDTTSYLNSVGESERGGIHGGIRGGIDLNVTPSDLFRLGFRLGSRSHDSERETDYEHWTEPEDTLLNYTSLGSFGRSGNFASVNFDYTHNFQKEGHVLSSQLNLRHRGGDEESLTELYDENHVITSGRKSIETGPGTRLEFKLDYVLPINEDDRIEAGYQTRFSLSGDENEMSELDPNSGEYFSLDEFSHSTEYRRRIQSTYFIYAGQIGNFGIQGGLRGEYTYRNIEMSGQADPFSIDRWDIYPTLHSSYQFGGGQQLMASYSRRIDRIRGWHLEPFLTWMDAYNVRRGNPDLKPEYIDSYETGYQKSIGKSLLSLETYYRVTHNKVERVRSVYDKDVFLHTFANVGKDYALGTELMLSISPFKWWNLNIMGNIYDYRVTGELYGESFSEGSFNWSSRLNNTFRIGQSTRFQMNAMYRSRSVNAQGSNGAMFFTNIAIRQDFMNRKLSATLQVRDLFGTASHYHKTTGPNFYSYMSFERQPRMLSFTLTYNINNYKMERDRNGQNDENGVDFGEEGGLE